jgi:hypothetical protein
MKKEIFKKTPEELQQYLQFKRRGFAISAKKGKGSYSRKQKHKDKEW